MLLLRRILIALLIVTASAGQAVTMNGFDLDNSLIPVNEIYRGGPPRDGIPALDEPRFTSAANADWLRDDDLVLGVTVNGQAKAYPVRILVWHEIVNDTLAGQPIAVTFCPLCGSGIVFERDHQGKQLDFGVSGLLHNSDLLMYDRQSESLWAQIPGKAISGPRRGQTLARVPVTHTQWQAWRKNHPDTRVLSTETGYRRNYNRYPYGDYERSARLVFPVDKRDDRFHPKTLVLGLAHNGDAKAWPFVELKKTDGRIEDTFAGEPVTIRYSDRLKAARAYDADGKQLAATTVFWFAWYSFYPFTEVFTADAK